MPGSNSLSCFFNPENIAVVGASNNPDKAGYVIINNLLKINYPKKIFPVNAHEENILGLSAYACLSDIPDKIELVILITPSKVIVEVMADIDARMAKKKDIKGIVCAAAGYAEINTPEGKARQQVLMEGAKRNNIRVIGPNCIGVIDNYSKIDTTFVETLMQESSRGKAGGISFISQSGAMAASILMWGASSPAPLSYSKFVSIGNMADVDFIDLLEYLEEDVTTKVIGLYMEGYPKTRTLIETMARIALKKPVVVLKVGRTSKGAAAASSHTGSLAGEDRVYESAFKQYGIIRVENIEEMIDTMRALDLLPLPRGNKVFLYTQAGGPGIFCMDALSKNTTLDFAHINESTREQLRNMLPSFATVCCPEGYADISASASVEQHVQGINLLIADPSVDAIVFITVVPTFLPRNKLAEEIANIYRKTVLQKPFYTVIMAGNWVREARETIEAAGLPTFETPDRAAKVVANVVRYTQFLKKGSKRPGMEGQENATGQY